MFTGIIQAIGNIAEKQQKGGDLRLRINTADLDLADVSLGDSIATNGVCLTVTGMQGDSFFAVVSNETLVHSTLADLPLSSSVNLEKAMLASSRFGGHIVSGHVDGVGKVTTISNNGRSIVIEIEVEKQLQHYIAHKGSITVDGISLTANALTANGFLLNIVPHTAEETIINSYNTGTLVNIEVDVIARYLERLLDRDTNNNETSAQKPKNISKDFLAQNGFYK